MGDMYMFLYQNVLSNKKRLNLVKDHHKTHRLKRTEIPMTFETSKMLHAAF